MNSKRVGGVDIVLMLDTTGSMAPWIDAAKTNLQTIIEKATTAYRSQPLRMGAVFYKDHCDRDKRLTVIPITSDITRVQYAIASQEAIGGGDTPEDVLGALDVVSKMEWGGPGRILIHVFDAPGHGPELYGDCDDEYPAGDPYGLTPRDVVGAIRDWGIQYFMLNVNAQNITAKTIQAFRKYYDKRNGGMFDLKVYNLGVDASVFLPTVTQAIDISVAALQQRTDPSLFATVRAVE
ncbi:Heat shock 70 kDa protein 12A [Borealophlyctis nickersoniae]|nr:Heat shock 70 kDa protein 12A [Borealophlyctis nickersoniae]